MSGKPEVYTLLIVLQTLSDTATREHSTYVYYIACGRHLRDISETHSVQVSGTCSN